MTDRSKDSEAPLPDFENGVIISDDGVTPMPDDFKIAFDNAMRDNIISVDGEDVRVGFAVEHNPGYVVFRALWDKRLNIETDAYQCEGNHVWMEVIATEDPEATSMIRSLVELGDRLRPLLLRLDREAAGRNRVIKFESDEGTREVEATNCGIYGGMDVARAEGRLHVLDDNQYVAASFDTEDEMAAWIDDYNAEGA